MQIATVVEIAQRGKLPPLQAKVLDFLESHSDEVYCYRDVNLADQLDTKPSGIGFSFWALHKAGLIGKESVAGKMYFGSRAAIRTLRQRLGKDDSPAFQRAIENAEAIRKRIGGNLNSLDVLDEVRTYSEHR